MTALIKVRVQRKAVVKLKGVVKFPADVVADPGIIITRSGRTYTFSLDATALPSANLQALADNTGAGLWAITGAGTGHVRTITGTAAEITVTFGDGVSGNPTLSIPAAVTFTGKTVTGGTFASPTLTSPTINAGTLAVGVGGGSINGYTIGGTAENIFHASNTSISDHSDITKKLKFDVSGVSTATTRTWIVPNSSDTMVGKATTDTFTNKTYDTAGTGNSFSINGVVVTANTGTGAVARAAAPTFTTPTLGVAAATSLALGGATIGSNALAVTGTSALGALAVTSSSASALAVGLNGATNPALLVDASTASSATGLKIKSAAAAAGLAVSVVTSGTNENLTIDAAGSGTITLGGTSSGAITLARPTTMNVATANTSVATPIVGPLSNSTTALKITKADLSTAVMTFDTTNARVGINKTPGAFDLDVNGAINGGSTLSVATGYQIAGAATSANYLRGNGTNFVSSAILAADLPLGSSSAFGAVKVDNTTITASGGVITAIGGAATSVTIGTTTVASGTTLNLLYNNAGVLANGTIASFLTAGTGIAITGTTNATISIASNAAFSATLGGSNQTGVASGTPTKITFNTKVYDIGTLFSTANNRWTPPAGTVQMSAGMLITGTWAASSATSIYIYKNGSPLIQSVTASITGQGNGALSVDDRANGTDYYEVWVTQSTTAGTVTVVGSTGPTFTYFTGHWVSP